MVEHREANERLGLPTGIRACLFDLDGVLTRTAELHAEAWRETFDAFLRDRSARCGAVRPVRPATRLRAVRRRATPLRRRPRVSCRAHDRRGTATVLALGDRKNERVLELIRRHGLEPYEGSVLYLQAVRDAGLRTAVVSASANCRTALEAAGLTELLEVRIDAARAEEAHLRGKPAPDTFLAAARELDVEPAMRPCSRTRRGGRRRTCRRFWLRRRRRSDRARRRAPRGGADLVVSDLGELLERR